MKKVVILGYRCKSSPYTRLCPVGKNVIPDIFIQGTDIERFRKITGKRWRHDPIIYCQHWYDIDYHDYP
jgi:hypothetical protein